MAVDTQQWASREELQALTAAQEQVRDRLSTLEGRFGESVRATDKHGATKADVTAVLVEVEKVRQDVGEMERRMLKVLISIGAPLLVGMALVLYRLFAGGVP